MKRILILTNPTYFFRNITNSDFTIFNIYNELFFKVKNIEIKI